MVISELCSADHRRRSRSLPEALRPSADVAALLRTRTGSDFVYLCPSAVPCGREWLVRPTTREFQKLHVVPDVPHDAEQAAVPDLTVHLLLDPREGHLRLGSKEGLFWASRLSARNP